MSGGFRHSNTYLLTVLTLVSTINWADRQVVPILFPGIRAELGLTDTELGVVGGLAFSLIYALAGFAFGHAADRYLRTYVIAFGLTVWSAATAAGALATDFWTLVAARFFTGIGEASLYPCALSLVAERFPPDRRGRALGTFGVAAALGAGLGVGLGGRLADAFGWRPVFVMYGAAGLALLPLVLALGEERRPPPAADGEPAWRAIPALVGDPRLLCMWLGGATAIGSGLGYAAWAPSFFVRHRGLALTEAAAIFGGGALLGGVAGSLLGGYLADWRRRVRLAGEFDVSVAAALIAAPLIVLTVDSTTLWIFAPSGIAASVAIYSFFPSLNAMLVSLVPKERHGIATAVNVFFMGGLGSAAGPFIVGLASDAFGSLHTAMYTPAAGVLIAAALVAMAGRFVRARG